MKTEASIPKLCMLDTNKINIDRNEFYYVFSKVYKKNRNISSKLQF